MIHFVICGDQQILALLLLDSDVVGMDNGEWIYCSYISVYVLIYSASVVFHLDRILYFIAAFCIIRRIEVSW